MVQRIQAVKEIVTFINRALQDFANGIIDEFNKLVDLIPHPPVVDLSELARILTCPLTPQAIMVEQLTDIISQVERNTASIPYPAKLAAGFTQAGTVMVREQLLLSTIDPRGLARRLSYVMNEQLRSIHRLIDEVVNSFGSITGYRYVDSRSTPKSPKYDPTTGLLPGNEGSANGASFTASNGYDYTVKLDNYSEGAFSLNDMEFAEKPTAPTGVVVESTKPKDRTPGEFRFSKEASLYYRVIMNYWNQIVRTIGRPDLFIMRLAVTTANVSLLRAICPEKYDDSVFQQFTEEMTSFSFDGVLPSGLDDAVQRLMEVFARLQSRLAEWEASVFVLGTV